MNTNRSYDLSSKQIAGLLPTKKRKKLQTSLSTNSFFRFRSCCTHEGIHIYFQILFEVTDAWQREQVTEFPEQPK